MEDSIKSQSQAVYQADGANTFAGSMLPRNRSEYNRSQSSKLVTRVILSRFSTAS